MRLGEILVEQGKATAEQVAAALEQQGELTPHRRIGEILVEEAVISEEDVLLALSEQYRTTVVSAVTDDMLDPELIKDLPVEWARNHQMLPVRYRSTCGVLTCDPSCVAEVDDLSLLLGRDLVPLLTTEKEIRRSIEACYYRREDSAEALISGLQEVGDSRDVATGKAEDLLRAHEQAPVTQLVNLILLEAVKARASDVHVEPFEDVLRVRYRIDGMLYGQASPPKHMEAALISRLKVMGRLDIAERRLPQDGMARVRVGETEIDIRVSTIPVAAGERVVLRLLNQESTMLPLSDLGMPDKIVEQFRGILQEANGAIWVTGPTGCGKTTTLYAALQELDTEHRNVLTIEDPVEYQLPNIGQISVKPKIGLTFAQGLRHILRQDPDVVFVGETRDLDTAEVAIRASLTGHLVFSTLHTNDAVGAVIRLVDMGIPPYLLSAATRAVLAQRLVRRLCQSCRSERMVSAAEVSALGKSGSALIGQKSWEPAGCDQCLGGYRDRTGLFELLTVGHDMREAMRQNVSLEELAALAEANGMLSLAQCGVGKVREGETSVSEVLRAVGRSEVARHDG